MPKEKSFLISHTNSKEKGAAQKQVLGWDAKDAEERFKQMCPERRVTMIVDKEAARA